MNRTTRAWVLAVLIGAVAAGAVLAATREGPGATVDSAEYLAVAEGVAGGDGLTMPYVSYDEPYPREVRPGARVPMIQFPPLYPAVLGGIGAVTGAGVTTVARWCGALVLGLIAGLVVVLVHRHTRSLGWSAAAGALVVNPDLVFVHAMAWSETLMLLFALTAMGALYAYVKSPGRWRLAAVVASGAATAVTRFAGVPVVLASAAVLAHRRRWKAAAATLVLGALPLVLWLARNAAVTGTSSERALVWHPPGAGPWYQALRSLTDWVVRDTRTTRHAVAFLLALLVVPLAAGSVRAVRRGLDLTSLPVLSAVFGVALAAFLVGSRSVLDNNISFDSRQFAVFHLLVIVGATAALPGARTRRSRLAGGTVVAAVVAMSLFRVATATVPGFPGTESAGYTSEAWDTSPTLASLAPVPDAVVVVTNAPDPVWLRYRRPAVLLPLTANLYTGRPNERYDDQLRSLARAVEGRPALLVFFDRPTRGRRRRVEPRVVSALGLVVERRFSDGTVYRVGTSPGPPRA